MPAGLAAAPRGHYNYGLYSGKVIPTRGWGVRLPDGILTEPGSRLRTPLGQVPVSFGGCSANHCAMLRIWGSKDPGMDTFSTPARVIPRFSKS